MKIYLGFTVAGSRSSIEAAKKILSVLESFGHDVLTSHLVSDDAWEVDRSVATQKIFARDMTWLAQCDPFVAGSSMTEQYGLMTASFLRVLILQRMLYENETAYIDTLERTWTSSIALRGYLLEGALGTSHAKEIETPMGDMENPQSTGESSGTLGLPFSSIHR